MQSSSKGDASPEECPELRSCSNAIRVIAVGSHAEHAFCGGMHTLEPSSDVLAERSTGDSQFVSCKSSNSAGDDPGASTAGNARPATHRKPTGVNQMVQDPPSATKETLSREQALLSKPLSSEATAGSVMKRQMGSETACRPVTSSSSVRSDRHRGFESPAATSQASRESCHSANMHKSGSAVSFLDAFHRQQRIQVCSELKRRDEAFHTLKHWRGGPKPSDTPLPQQRSAASACVRSSRPSNDVISRKQLVGEMAALFSSLSITKRQRASSSYKQTIGQLEQQCKHVAELIQRLSSTAPVHKARGALVKARSLQLQLHQQEQRSGGQRRRLPPHLLLPLPSFTSRCRNGEASADIDPWRRLLRRVGPKRRRASAPPSVGRSSDFRGQTVAVKVPSPSPLGGASAGSEAVARVGAIGNGEPEARFASHCAAIAEAAAQDAAAAAIVVEFSDKVDRFASRHRSASVGWGGPRRTSHTGPKMAKELGDELLQQAEVCCAAVADSPAVWRTTLIRSLETFSRILKAHVAKYRQRSEVASLVEKRVFDWESRSSPCGTARPEIVVPVPRCSSAVGTWEAQASSERELDRTESTTKQKGGSRLESNAVPADSVSPGASWADLVGSPDHSISCSKETSDILNSEFAEDDSSLLDAETDCEYLLGRQLLPYERMLLKYRMLRRSATANCSKSYDETTEAHLVEQLLQAIDDGSALPGDTVTPDEDEDLCAFWGNKEESEAAKIERLLGMVGELQEADMQQRNHVQQFLLPSQNCISEEERVLRSFFEQGNLPEGSESEMKTLNSQSTTALPSLEQAPETSAADAGSLGTATEFPSFSFPTAERLYRAHYLVGPWRGSSSAYPPPKPQQ